MVKHAAEYAIGEGTKPGVTHGPVQNRMQYDRVKTFFDDIAKQGWEVALGGKMDDSPQKGYYITPTIIDRPPEKSRIVVEEPFGR
jgi:acyl-CoA reductase-like NAD-dependent aldehyde dehydrogenase